MGRFFLELSVYKFIPSIILCNFNSDDERGLKILKNLMISFMDVVVLSEISLYKVPPNRKCRGWNPKNKFPITIDRFKFSCGCFQWSTAACSFFDSVKSIGFYQIYLIGILASYRGRSFLFGGTLTSLWKTLNLKG